MIYGQRKVKLRVFMSSKFCRNGFNEEEKMKGFV